MKKVFVVCLALMIVIGVAAALEAKPPGKWHKIGSRTVTDRIDHDVMTVTRDHGEWRAIKIVVNNRAVQFHDVKVFFANGSVQDIKLRTVIPAGGESRVIDLVGNHRVIKKIEFRYDAQSLGGKAVVKVFGKK